MTFFRLYQFVVPLLLLPLSYWLWWDRYHGDHRMVWLALSLPVVFAYVIPGIGTNWLRLWEFNTKFRLGRFRPHHGLVFGTATSLLALATLDADTPRHLSEVLRAGFVLGSVLAFWNWLYDAYAIKAGFIKVYTLKQYQAADPETVATDYAPILFGVFGMCYGLTIRSYEYVLVSEERWNWMWLLLLAGQVACLITPVLAYVTVSFLRTGQSGLQSYEHVSREI